MAQLGHMVDIFSASWGFFVVISRVEWPVCIPMGSKCWFPFPHIFSFVVSCFLDVCHFDIGEMKSQSYQNCFNCNIQIPKNDEHFLRFLIEIIISSFDNSLLTSMAQFLTWLLVSLPLMVFVLFCFRLLYTLNINPLAGV